MRGRVGALAALMAVSGGLVGLPSPAGAETVVASYERGNAPATIDITRLRVTNGNDRFAMQVKVRDLRKKGRFSFYYWPGRHGTPPPHSVILVVRHDAAGMHQRFLTCGREDCSAAPCRSFRASWRPGDDVVRVSARQRCLPGTGVPSAGRFSASAEAGGDVDPGSPNVLVERG